MTQAFNDILKTAITQSAPGGIASASASGSRLSSGSVAYVASYSYDTSSAAYDATHKQWGVTASGAITGTINGWSGSVMANAGNSLYAAPLWAKGAWVPAARNIFTAGAGGTGISFLPVTAPATGLSGDSGDTLAASLTQDDVNAVRNNPLGDIVNSQLAYVGQPARLSLDPTYAQFVSAVNAFNGSKTFRNGVLYVGANDGMLHGFDAGQGTAAQPGTGQELMAYVPRGLLTALHASTFANASYAHRYWVDGSPFSGDTQLDTGSYGLGTDSGTNPGNWATVLVGALGGGGPGYFVLDVTDPLTFSSASNAGKLALIDATDTSGAGPLAGQTVTNGPEKGKPVANYIGYQFSPPVMEMYTTNQSAQIVQINTQDKNAQGDSVAEWAVIMGNGYNSASGVPALLIQSLSHPGRPLYTVSAACTSTAANCTARGNGLSAPRPIDVDGNGTADIVYAGDLMGNLWKFDISNPDHTQWNVAYGGQPMFTAVGPTGVAQPITSAPVAAPDLGKGGFMVAFGTGQNLTDADTVDTRLNSVYALYDNQPMSQTSTGADTPVGYITLGAPPASFCTSGGGGNGRYACLYQQTGGAISSGTTRTTSANVNVISNVSSTLKNVNIDGTTMRGWYYDIPETDNGNAGKVLDNPLVMSGNMLLFYSQNVASSSGTSSAASSNGANESCDSATLVSGGLTTVNFFDLFTGNVPDNTITIGDLSYNGVGTYVGNRFRIVGATRFIPSGADSLSAVGLDATITSAPSSTAPGRRVGWRIGR